MSRPLTLMQVTITSARLRARWRWWLTYLLFSRHMAL